MTRSRRIVINILAAFFLLVISGLLVGRTLHIYSHLDHSHQEQSSTERSHSSECSLCNYVMTAIEDAVEQMFTLTLLVVSVPTLYLLSETYIYLTTQNSRAPPAVIS